jgi:hypothetical protein
VPRPGGMLKENIVANAENTSWKNMMFTIQQELSYVNLAKR